MCKTCFDVDNRVEISGMRELADLVGGGDRLVIPNEDYRQWPEEVEREFRDGPRDNCLCPVDIGWTLIRAGFAVWLNDMGEIAFERKVKSDSRFGLTERQGDVFGFIKAYVEKHDGVSPSFDEIRIGIGIASKGRVAEMVSALEERGLIRRLPHKARSIALVERSAA